MVSSKDREIIRKHAGRYAEMVTSDEMARRRNVWRLHNRREARTVPFSVEDNGTYIRDLMGPLETAGEDERRYERFFKSAIIFMETIPDDHPFPDYYPVNWMIGRPEICPDLKRTMGADVNGRELGFETNKPLADLASGLKRLQRGDFTVDRDLTHNLLALSEDIFGDLLPARLVNDSTLRVPTGLTAKAVLMMGMDNFYIAMMDQPGNVHKLYEFITAEREDYLQWMVAEKLIRPNAREVWSGSGSFTLTDELPQPDDTFESCDVSRCFGFTEAQEAVGISNEMFAEFIFPYQSRLTRHFGQIKFGCCEPVHPFWETVSRFENLRKVSVSPWCDLQFVAEKAGKEIILSRKPEALKLCGEQWDREGFRSHMKEMLDTFSENFVEIIFRDTCTLSGAMKTRLPEACEIVRELSGAVSCV